MRVTVGRVRFWAIVMSAVLSSSSCTGLGVKQEETFRKSDPEATRGGRIRIGVAAPASIDPGVASDPSGMLISSLVCEPLIQIDPITGRLANGMVESMVVGVQGSAFTIKLRNRIKFHNGQTLSAQDVVYALSRVSRHDFAGPRADVLSPIAGFEVINAPPPPTKDVDPEKRTLSGARVISRTALEIALQEQNADFLTALSLPPAAPVPRGLPDRDKGFADQPICAGPYRLTRPYRQGDPVIELHRFRDYYAKNRAFTAGGAGYPDVIEFHLISDRNVQMQRFSEGQLDIALVAPEKLGEAKLLGSQLVTTPVPAVEYIGLPAGQASFQDPEVRALLSRAIDRNKVVDEVFSGGRLPAGGFLPPIFGNRSAGACVSPGPASAEAAPTALLGAKYEFKVNDDFSNLTLAEEVATQWKQKLGLDISVVPMSWDKYVTEATGPRGIDGFFRESWIPPYPSIDEFLRPLFHSSEIGNNNFARFNSRTFDRRIDRVARREQDEVLRQLKYFSLEELLCRDLPMIPITFGQEEYLVRVDRIGAASGDFFDRMSGQPLVRELFVRHANDAA